MNDERIVSLLSAQTAALSRIAIALETIAMTNAPAPNFIKSIEMYADFDFTTIGAVVKQYDQNGPTELEWGSYLWTRRSPQNKFGEAIWFSRAVGKDAEGNNKYARLITFKRMTEAEPLPRKVEALVENKKAEQPKQTAPSKPADGGSELDQHFGPNPRNPVSEKVYETIWPTTEVEFTAWLKTKSINGKETHRALGTDAKTYLRKNPGTTWADVAKTIAGTLGK